MNPKLVVLGLVIVCAVSVQSFKYKHHYPHYYGGDCDCDGYPDYRGGPCCDGGYPCGGYAGPWAPGTYPPNPCGTVHVSPVVGLLSKMKAKVVAKLCDDDWGYGGCGGCGHGCKGGKKCKWLHSPYLWKRYWAANKYC
ncbi:unnamed protein product [Phyllotreta striolata]|uniref:Uncharacterized protein n=1 Tax=Phyllotreta striolata TaxID=444603 RepID=A0A9N9XS90_PHYSR|nr:unnamed protein product [Phyllotreta striolata]